MPRKYVVVAVLVLSAGLTTLTVALIWRTLSAQRVEVEIARERSRIERFVSLERWDDAVAAIRGVADEIPDPDAWIPFLRHARLVEQNGGEEGFGLEMAEVATERFAENARLNAVFVLMLLENDNTDEAAARAESLPTGEFEGVVAEARLRSGEGRMPVGGSEAAALTTAVIDPNPDNLEEAWEASREPFFAHNAALLWLGRGDRERAAELTSELPVGAPHSELAFLLAVEQESVEQAREHLEAIPSERQASPEVLLARADLAYLSGDTEQRRLLIEDSIASEPDHDPVAYLALSELRGSVEDQMETLRTGHSVFPSNVPIAMNLARLLEVQGMESEAVDVLEDTEEQRDEPDERLAFYRIQLNPEYSRTRRRTATWELLEAFPESSEIGGHLASRAVDSGDTRGLSLLLAHEGVEQAPWAASVRAAVDFSRGTEDRAIQRLERAGNRFWFDEFNYGLLLLNAERLGDAADAFERAAGTAVDHGAGNEHLADIYLRAAETAVLRGQDAGALELARQAVEYDPESARGRMLIRSLGEG